VTTGTLTCSDSNTCTNDSCNPTNGVCSNVANTNTCNDNLLCTTGDVCSAGVCGGTPKSCDDGNPCTADCYFDKDDGDGNDTCEWSRECDPLSVANPTEPAGTPVPPAYPAYTPSLSTQCRYDDNKANETAACNSWMADQADTCFSTAPKPVGATKWNYCGELTPNGCDCFGCCYPNPG